MFSGTLGSGFSWGTSLGVTLHTGALSGGEDGHFIAHGHSTGTHGLWALHGHGGNQRAAVCGGVDSDLQMTFPVLSFPIYTVPWQTMARES